MYTKALELSSIVPTMQGYNKAKLALREFRKDKDGRKLRTALSNNPLNSFLKENGCKIVSKALLVFYPKTRITCIECGELVNWNASTCDYNKYCSHYCKNSSPIFIKQRRKTCKELYGHANYLASEECKAHTKELINEQFGVDYISQAPEIKEKKRQTALVNYGYNSHTQSPEWQAECEKSWSNNNPMHKRKSVKKMKQTNLEKYGVDNPSKNLEVQEKIKQVITERYGVDNIFKSEEFKEYMKQPEVLKQKLKNYKKTSLAVYGYESPTQHPDVLDKMQKSNFAVTTIECLGNEVQCQGYEERVCNWLQEQKGVRKISNPRLSLPYKFCRKRRRYIPDLLVNKKGKKLLIEVKSEFTLGCSLRKGVTNATRFRQNKAKFKAAVKYCNENNMKFFIFLVVGKTLHIIKNPTGRLVSDIKNAYKLDFTGF